MAKRLIRLTEGDLHNIIKESVKRILREGKFDNNKPFFNGPSGKIGPGVHAYKFANPDADASALDKHNERALKYFSDITGKDELDDRQNELEMSRETGMPPHMYADTIQGKLRSKRQGEYYDSMGYKPLQSPEEQEAGMENANEGEWLRRNFG